MTNDRRHTTDDGGVRNNEELRIRNEEWGREKERGEN